ncbi:GNAT family N-acetyltransferase [Streptomyces sp. R39]|uniref:GNAT family N-acetyltransferase n=1 Tax=Streptomyces sp. R39 TaxID=3238631 RepID=A0AB39QNR1_9ACTN
MEHSPNHPNNTPDNAPNNAPNSVETHSDLSGSALDKVPVGFLQGQVPHGAWIEKQVTLAPAAYLSRLFIEPTARRKSVGRGLVTVAHDVVRAHGAKVTMLHHSLHNPFAAPFWAELGYRPVLTTWSKRLPETG